MSATGPQGAPGPASTGKAPAGPGPASKRPAGKPPAGSRGAQARLIAAGIAIALIVVFAILNLGKVKVDWIVGSSHTSLTIVIAVSFLLGALTGGLLIRRRMKS